MKRASWHLVGVLLWFFAIAAHGQQSMQSKVDALLKLATDAPTKLEGAQAVDKYLGSLPDLDRFELEGATFGHLRKIGAISRTNYIQNMLELNERYAPRDHVTLDYWRYLRMISTKVDKGTMAEEEYQYLSAKKYDEATMAKERQEREPQPVYQAQQPQATPDNTGLVLQSIGQALRSRADSLRPLGSPTNCTSRNIGGTVYTDCR